MNHVDRHASCVSRQRPLSTPSGRSRTQPSSPARRTTFSYTHRFCHRLGDVRFSPSRLPPGTSRRRIAGWTPARQAAFLAALADGHTVAAASVGRSARSADHRHAADGADFVAVWNAALLTGADQLDDTARARTIYGKRRPVFYRGEVVGERVVHDTALLLRLLKRRSPLSRKSVGG